MCPLMEDKLEQRKTDGRASVKACERVKNHFLWQYRGGKKAHLHVDYFSISVIVHALLYRINRKSAYVAIEHKS